jgi:2-succinyl-5-enolpyruvyl-6-hydroxy-3-cyclohexene-1-carboxylate synthase
MNEGITSYLGAFMDELARSGVKDVVVSPGSRSTPLALLAAEHPDIKVWLNIDERSAGFYALGMAKSKRSAVALLCTSGTAAANYLPAVAEAHLARVPLVVLTADRPHELRDVGAPQTIDQIGLYGSHVKWFAEMPIPEASAPMMRHARATASRAVAVAASSPAGPVHLNFPLREPLIPDLQSPSLWSGGRQTGLTYTAVSEGRRVPEEAILLQLAGELGRKVKGIIICGPHDEPGFAEAVSRLAARLQYPVLADPLSQLRSGNHDRSLVIDGYDAFLRDENAAVLLQPEVILRFGAMPVSKPLLQFITRHPDSRHLIVDEGAGWREPTLLATDMIHAHPIELCDRLYPLLNGQRAERDLSWTSLWLDINEATAKVLQDTGDFAELFEGQLFPELGKLLPPRSTLFVGNSMPIRDLDTFYRSNPHGIRIMGNRGANGIDGLVSTALGASSSGSPTVLVLGDLSFYHDMNGLLAAKLHGLDITIIIVNNDGGGIFSFLPQAEVPKHFEELFGTPAGLDYEMAVRMYGGRFTRTDSWEAFREAFQASLENRGLQVIEIPTVRESNVTLHRTMWKKLSAQLAPLLQEGRA